MDTATADSHAYLHSSSRRISSKGDSDCAGPMLEVKRDEPVWLSRGRPNSSCTDVHELGTKSLSLLSCLFLVRITAAAEEGSTLLDLATQVGSEKMDWGMILAFLLVRMSFEEARSNWMVA